VRRLVPSDDHANASELPDRTARRKWIALPLPMSDVLVLVDCKVKKPLGAVNDAMLATPTPVLSVKI